MHITQNLLVLTAILRGTLAAPYGMTRTQGCGSLCNRATKTYDTQSSCSNGQLVCSTDGAQFGICDWGQVTFQAVAPGTTCRNGAIVGAKSSVSSAVPLRPSRPAPYPSSVAPGPKVSTSMTYVSYTATVTANTSATATQTLSSVSATSPSTKSSSVPSYVPSPTTTGPSTSATGLAGTNYHVYLGNGDTSQGWPEMSAWATFDDMWAKNAEYTISGACAAFGVPENTQQNTADLKDAILAEANSTGIDARFIFAIVMQESTGCVRVDTTFGSVPNPGLMQSHNGSSTCYDKTDCPVNEIRGMIKDGVQGTSSGDGLQQLLAQTNTTDVAKYYRAARMYNSGSIAANGLLQCGVATSSYASDIANRLTMAWYRGTRTFPTNACPDNSY